MPFPYTFPISFEFEHTILQGVYGQRVRYTNRVQVFGGEPTSIFTEDYDWAELDLVGDVLDQDIDINLDTVAKGHDKGAAILADALLQSLTGYIVVPMNVGQEIYDYIEITDSRAGLSSEKKRILGLGHVYDPSKGRYDLTIYFRGSGGSASVRRSSKPAEVESVGVRDTMDDSNLEYSRDPYWKGEQSNPDYYQRDRTPTPVAPPRPPRWQPPSTPRPPRTQWGKGRWPKWGRR